MQNINTTIFEKLDIKETIDFLLISLPNTTLGYLGLIFQSH